MLLSLYIVTYYFQILNSNLYNTYNFQSINCTENQYFKFPNETINRFKTIIQSRQTRYICFMTFYKSQVYIKCMLHLKQNMCGVSRFCKIKNGHKWENIGLISLILVSLYNVDYTFLVSNEAVLYFYF